MRTLLMAELLEQLSKPSIIKFSWSFKTDRILALSNLNASLDLDSFSIDPLISEPDSILSRKASVLALKSLKSDAIPEQLSLMPPNFTVYILGQQALSAYCLCTLLIKSKLVYELSGQSNQDVQGM